MKRIVSLIMASALFVSLAVPAFAQDVENPENMPAHEFRNLKDSDFEEVKG